MQLHSTAVRSIRAPLITALSSLILAVSLSSKSRSVAGSPFITVANTRANKTERLSDRLWDFLRQKPHDNNDAEPEFIAHPPTAEQTNGIDPFLVRLCAQISADLYDMPPSLIVNGLIKLPDNSELKTPPTVVLCDNSDPFTNNNDPFTSLSCFAAIVAGDKLILGWRGSRTPMDFDRDASFCLGVSFRWKSLAKVIKVHAGVLSLVESTFVVHEDELLDIIDKHKIKKILLTGHSLGGSAAQVAQLWLEAAMDSTIDTQPNKWQKLAKNGLSVHTLSFEGFSTTLFAESKDIKDEELNQKGKDFINKCASNMCTTVFKQDPAPRLFSHVETFGMDFLENAIDIDIEESKLHLVGLLRPLRNLFHVKLQQQLPKLETLWPTLNKYQHLGKLLHYESSTAMPKVYIDNMNGILVDNEGDTPQFGDIKYVPIKKNVYVEAFVNHMKIVRGPGLAWRK